MGFKLNTAVVRMRLSYESRLPVDFEDMGFRASRTSEKELQRLDPGSEVDS
jgi:hypothetical protein